MPDPNDRQDDDLGTDEVAHEHGVLAANDAAAAVEDDDLDPHALDDLVT